MFEVEGTKITLTRGDTAYLGIDLYKNKNLYTLKEGDVVRFALKNKLTDDSCLIKKGLAVDSDGQLYLQLNPEDTKALPFLKTYKYDIEMTTAEGEVFTFVKGDFYLDGEVD